jgi:hypothetical protein
MSHGAKVDCFIFIITNLDTVMLCGICFDCQEIICNFIICILFLDYLVYLDFSLEITRLLAELPRFQAGCGVGNGKDGL